jgi:polyhydroxybutyrate depolymerase
MRGMMTTRCSRVALVAAAAIALGAARARADDDAEKTKTIDVGGVKRSYLIHVPPSLKRQDPTGIVFVFHGGRSVAENMVKLTRGRFDALADRDGGMLVVYPNGTGDGKENHWNHGIVPEEADDVGFVSAMIEHVAENRNLDRARIFATGMSDGACMCERLACDLSEKIAAIAPVSGALSVPLASAAKPRRPVSVLLVNGTDDAIFPWAGGEVHLAHGRKGKVLSVHDAVRFWVERDGCAADPTVTREPDRDPSDGTRVERRAHAGGRDGSEVVLLKVEGGGHTWPGGDTYRDDVGRTSRDIDACDEIWEFFRKHARVPAEK